MKRPDFHNASLIVDAQVEAGQGGSIAFIAQDATLTYEDLRRRVNRMASALQALGVRREQRVLLALDNTTAFPVAFLGAMRIGAVPVPVSVRSSPEDFRHFIADSYAEVVVCDAPLLAGIQRALVNHDLLYVARDADSDN